MRSHPLLLPPPRRVSQDPYVKKTAAVCVAKLYDISPELVRDQGFIDTLRDLISDANPSVGAHYTTMHTLACHVVGPPQCARLY